VLLGAGVGDVVGVVAAVVGPPDGAAAAVGLELVGLGVEGGLGVRVIVAVASGSGVSGAAHVASASRVPKRKSNASNLRT